MMEIVGLKDAMEAIENQVEMMEHKGEYSACAVAGLGVPLVLLVHHLCRIADVMEARWERENEAKAKWGIT